AEAYNNQDTHFFNRIMHENKDSPFLADEVLQRRLTEMYTSLLERHLLKLLEPYSRVQISYLASLLKLDVETVESQVSQLILDKKLAGIVDQQHQCVVVFDEQDAKIASKNQKQQRQQGMVSGGGGERGSSSAAGPTYKNAKSTTEDGGEKATTTLYQDALEALDKYDRLVSALFDKASGKFDALVEENLKRRQEMKTDKKKDSKKGEEKEDAEKKKKNVN
ncbi:proteasome regulatory non-ATPase subunit 6, partial [Trypanosoma cruzi]